MVRTVVLLKCLRASGYFQTGNATADAAKNNQELSPDELYIGKLLFHFQTGIQYNLHAVYQVSVYIGVSPNFLFYYFIILV